MPPLPEEKLGSVESLTKKLGIQSDLGIQTFDPGTVEEVEHYILELQETMIPYGLHTFGVSPDGEALDDLADAICDASPEITLENMKSRLAACGENELASLVKALNGGFMAAAEGNDPVRNPDAVPTGNNFYGFNIDKVPSKEAWAMGKKLADEMISTYQEKHGVYPEKMGLILWSTELQRNEGASVAAVFHLLGITPVWDKKDQVVDIVPIPGQVLNRPRIDVLVQFIRSFQRQLCKADQAHGPGCPHGIGPEGCGKFCGDFITGPLRRPCLRMATPRKRPGTLSRARVFAPMPGAYSHAMQELIPNSGVWENEEEIADVFIHHYSYAYGSRIWGKSLKSGYLSNLKDVKMTMHTRSSNVYNLLDNDDMFAFSGRALPGGQAADRCFSGNSCGTDAGRKKCNHRRSSQSHWQGVADPVPQPQMD